MGLLRELRAADRLRVRPYDVAVIAGDGIGPEVIDAAIPVLDAAAKQHGFALAWERLPYSAIITSGRKKRFPRPRSAI